MPPAMYRPKRQAMIGTEVSALIRPVMPLRNGVGPREAREHVGGEQAEIRRDLRAALRVRLRPARHQLPENVGPIHRTTIKVRAG